MAILYHNIMLMSILFIMIILKKQASDWRLFYLLEFNERILDGVGVNILNGHGVVRVIAIIYAHGFFRFKRPVMDSAQAAIHDEGSGVFRQIPNRQADFFCDNLF